MALGPRPFTGGFVFVRGTPARAYVMNRRGRSFFLEGAAEQVFNGVFGELALVQHLADL